MIRAVGISWLADEWIRSHQRPAQHPATCQCSDCDNAKAAAFMSYILKDLHKTKKLLLEVQTAQAASVRAYRNSLK